MTLIKIIITSGTAVLHLYVFDYSMFTACSERTPAHYIPSSSPGILPSLRKEKISKYISEKKKIPHPASLTLTKWKASE